MPIPYRLNPMGKNEKKYFELIIKPGILTTVMSYGFTPYWNTGGYCKVDWGDGQKEDATRNGTTLNHTYVESGTYTVKIKAECYRVRFDTTGKTLIESCSESLNNLGDLTNGNSMFSGCTNAKLPLTSLPEGLTNGASMFNNCYNAQFSIIELPEGLTNSQGMFSMCTKGTIIMKKLPPGLTNCAYMFQQTGLEASLDELAENAPAAGWTDLTDITYMFGGCSKVTGSRSAFLAKCPANVTGADTAFNGTNTTE